MSEYRRAGVDLDAHGALVARLRAVAAGASRPEVLAAVGPFAGAMALPQGLAEPVLVASTDSVGTKVLLAAALGRYREVGQDVVVHCANDVATSGARPLLFLDYLAVHSLEGGAVLEVVAGIAEACRACGSALLGGETAQLPDLYRPGTWDLAGTMVGACSRAELVVPAARPGDAILGLPSSGLHTNGYSLVRAVLERTGTDPAPAADMLLCPSRLYSPDVARLQAEGVTLRGLAHITGGGLPGNLCRALCPGTDAVLDPGAWHRPAVFRWLQDLGGLAEEEMRRVFNLGVGFCVLVPDAEADSVLRLLPGARRIGQVVAGDGRVRFAGS